MHTIRLRHPWQCEVREGQALWLRKFNWLAERQDGEAMWLVVEPLSLETQALIVQVSLNEKALLTDELGRWDVTAWVAKHNLLTIATSEVPEDGSPCPFDVRLEIVAQ